MQADEDVLVPGLVARDPVTNNPLTVYHVSNFMNPGPFLGTVEDPFETIQQAQSQIIPPDLIFTHAGSVYTGAPDAVVVVNDNEQIFGEGRIDADRVTEHLVPVQNGVFITLPESPNFIADDQLLRPILDGAPLDSVTLANDSQFSGFIVQNAGGDGIVANGVANLTVNQNLVDNALGDGIQLTNTAGVIQMTDTVIRNYIGNAMHIDGGAPLLTFRSSDPEATPNLFAQILNAPLAPLPPPVPVPPPGATAEAALLVENTIGGFVNFSGSETIDTGGTGILVRDTAGSVTLDNVFLQNTNGRGLEVDGVAGTVTVRDTVMNTFTGFGGNFETIIDNVQPVAGGSAFGVHIHDTLVDSTVTLTNTLVTNRQDIGVNVVDVGGNVFALGGITVGAQQPGTLPSPAINVEGTQASSIINFLGGFGDTISIFQSLGRGINVENNAAGSFVNFQMPISVDAPTAEGVFIGNDAAEVAFQNGITITNRLAEGVAINNTTGVKSIFSLTSVGNALLAEFPAIDIQDSQGSVRFENAVLTQATGNNLTNAPSTPPPNFPLRVGAGRQHAEQRQPGHGTLDRPV